MEQTPPDRDLRTGPAGAAGPADVAEHDALVDDPIERRQLDDAMRGPRHDNPFPLWRRILAQLRGSKP